ERVQGIAVARDLARREVDHRVRAARDLCQVLRVEDRAPVEPEARMALEPGEVLEGAVGEVVEAGHLVAPLQEPLHEVRPDEAGRARDGDPQPGPPARSARPPRSPRLYPAYFGRAQAGSQPWSWRKRATASAAARCPRAFQCPS